jgi:hypothetical protein
LQICTESVGGVRQQSSLIDGNRNSSRDVGYADDLVSVSDVEMCEEVCLRLDGCIAYVDSCLDLGEVQVGSIVANSQNVVDRALKVGCEGDGGGVAGGGGSDVIDVWCRSSGRRDCNVCCACIVDGVEASISTAENHR